MNKYRNAVFIVAYRIQNKKPIYLVLKRKLHWKGWEFPKGGIEASETPMQAVVRELKEEANLTPKKIINLNYSGKFKYDKKTQKERGFCGQTYNLFAVEVNSLKAKYSKTEHSGYKWLELKPAYKILAWRNQRKCLNLVNSYLNHASNK